MRGARRTYAYVAAPRERANPPTAGRWAFFSSLLGQWQMIVVQYPEGFKAGSTARAGSCTHR